MQEDFEREAKLLYRLRHDALPRVLDYFKTDDGKQFLVMEFIQGQDMSELLEERQRQGQDVFPIAQVMDWAAQILDALVYLHTHFETPIIHRDIKPQNLKLTPQGRVVLLDFGLAKGALAGVAAASVPGSSPIYSPLEQADEQGTDVRSDLYSLATTLHHLLTGQTPPGATTRAGKILNQQPDPLRLAHELNPQVPPPVSAVLQKAAAVVREERYPTAQAMRTALQQVTTTAPTSFNFHAPESDTETIVQPRRKERIVVPIGGEQLVMSPKSFTEILNGVSLEMMLVPAGKFRMGSDKYTNEQPIREVRVPSFYIGKFQITQKQWQALMGTTIQQQRDKANKDWPLRGEGAAYPMYYVSWHEAQAFCEKLLNMSGKAYRLPSEAEWEYACRAGTSGDYAGKLHEMGWYGNNSGRNVISALKIWQEDSGNYWDRIVQNGNQSHPVGQKKPNGFGLYDMHGNVWEWCEDLCHENYNGAPKDGSAWVKGGSQQERVLRGGSWYDNVNNCRSASRLNLAPDGINDNVGLRVVVSASTS